MKRSAKIALQAGYWISYLILVMVIMGVLYGREENVDEARIEKAFIILTFIALLPSAISFYSFYYFIFPTFFQKKKFLQTLIFGTFISLGAAMFGYFVLNNYFADTCSDEMGSSDFIGIILFMTLITEISGVIALLMKGFITWFEELKLREDLSKRNHEIEMALVKSQLDPHFLFNTINNIDVLIIKDPELASSYLNKLSDIMRFMLYETKSDEIPLIKEIEYIQKYIELQRIRTANKNYIDLEINGDIDCCKIAPMLFIPFIENAVKHTTNKKIPEAIKIKINIESSQINFQCVNKYENFGKAEGKEGGLGNKLIQRRLDLLYKGNYVLNVDKQKNQYSVNLSIANG